MTFLPSRLEWGKELLRGGRAVELTLGGASMRPLLGPGDRITVVPASASTLRPGDLVLCEVRGALVCHRLIRVDDAGVHLRGDASPAGDPPLPPAPVLGRVAAFARHPDGRRLSLQSVRGRMLSLLSVGRSRLRRALDRLGRHPS